MFFGLFSVKSGNYWGGACRNHHSQKQKGRAALNFSYQYGLFKDICESMGSSLRMTVAEECNKIDLSRMIRSDGLIDICREYNLKKYSSTSSVVDGVNQRLSKDRKLCNRLEILGEKLIKGQPETWPLPNSNIITSVPLFIRLFFITLGLNPLSSLRIVYQGVKSRLAPFFTCR